ncbi:hypothetical protein FRC08_009592 [Ceratobasidium sp. 394]|nr:hypothetical protein FRC08_009592 [Ceratobasidium sp. 394]
MIPARTILRRTPHTTSRLRAYQEFEKRGDEVGPASGKTYVVSEPTENEKAV